MAAASRTIRLESQVFDLALHPREDLLIAGCIDGSIGCSRFTPEGAGADFAGRREWLQPIAGHGSCRSLQFLHDGSRVAAAFQDATLAVLDVHSQGAVISETAGEPGAQPISATAMLSETLLAVGDEAGTVRLWDLRSDGVTGAPVMEWHAHSDYITDFAPVTAKATLLATSADGRLSVMDLRQKKRVKALSELQDDELHSVVVVKQGRKVVVGTQEGVLSIFDYGRWGDCTDRFPGHPDSVGALLALDEDTVATGASDGLVRVLSVHPNKLIGAIGDHGDFPVERLAIDHARRYVVSCSHDDAVRFWHVGLGDGDSSGSDSDSVAAPDAPAVLPPKRKAAGKAAGKVSGKTTGKRGLGVERAGARQAREFFDSL